MGNWSEQQEVKKDTKEKDKVSRETLGKFFYDLAKLTFAAMVVGGTISWFSDSENSYYWMLLLIGLVSTVLLSYIGYRIIKR